MRKFIPLFFLLALCCGAFAQQFGSVVPGACGGPAVPCPQGASGGGGTTALQIPNFTKNLGLPKTKACLAKVKASTGNCKVMFIGDSLVAGDGAAWQTTVPNYGRAAAVASQFAQELAIKWNVPATSQSLFGDAGIGTAAYLTSYDPRLTLTGTVTASAFTTAGGNAWNLSAGGSMNIDFSGLAQFPGSQPQTNDTSPLSKTNTFVAFPVPYGGGDTQTISVNGGAALTTWNDAGGSLLPVTATATLGTNVWNLNCTNGGSAGCFNVGGYAYNSTVSQVLVLNAGWIGSATGNWIGSAGTAADPLLAIAAIAPDLCIIQGWGNDVTAGTAIATYESNFTAINAKCALTGDVLIVTSKPGAVSSASYATQQSYAVANSVVAGSTYPIYDWFQTLCGYSAPNCTKNGWTAGGPEGWMSNNFGNNNGGDPHGGPPHYSALAAQEALIVVTATQ